MFKLTQQLFDVLALPPYPWPAHRYLGQLENASGDDVRAFLSRWENSFIGLLRMGHSSLMQLAMMAWYATPEAWAHCGYPDRRRRSLEPPPETIRRARSRPSLRVHSCLYPICSPRASPAAGNLQRLAPGRRLELEADVVVVGTGAGGGTTAEILSAAGLKVLLVEEGPLKTSSDFKMQEADAYPELYRKASAG